MASMVVGSIPTEANRISACFPESPQSIKIRASPVSMIEELALEPLERTEKRIVFEGWKLCSYGNTKLFRGIDQRILIADRKRDLPSAFLTSLDVIR